MRRYRMVILRRVRRMSVGAWRRSTGRKHLGRLDGRRIVVVVGLMSSRSGGVRVRRCRLLRSRWLRWRHVGVAERCRWRLCVAGHRCRSVAVMCVEMLMLLLLVRHHGLCRRRRRRSHHASIVSIRILEEELRWWQEPSCSTRHIWVAASPCNHDDSSTVS